MAHRRRTILAFSLIFAVILLVYFLWPVDIEQDSSAALALVNGRTVLYEQVRADPNVAKVILGPEANESRIAQELFRIESRRVAQIIRSAIFEDKTKEYGLTASEEEVDARIDEIIQKSGLTNDEVRQICESTNRMRAALEAWHANPEQAKAIYDEKLAPFSTTPEHWRMSQIAYDTPEKLKDFVAPNNLDEIKDNSRQSSKKDVLNEKLEGVITKDVSVSTDEVEAAYENRYSQLPDKPTFDAIKEKLHSELVTIKKQEAINRWWKQQYNEADIEITDPRFQNVLDTLRKQGRLQRTL